MTWAFKSPGDLADRTESVARLPSKATGNNPVGLRVVQDSAEKKEEEDGEVRNLSGRKV